MFVFSQQEGKFNKFPNNVKGILGVWSSRYLFCKVVYYGPDSIKRQQRHRWQKSQKNLHYCYDLSFFFFFSLLSHFLFSHINIDKNDLSLFVKNRELGPFVKAFHNMLKTDVLHTSPSFLLFFLLFFLSPFQSNWKSGRQGFCSFWYTTVKIMPGDGKVTVATIKGGPLHWSAVSLF